MQNFNDNDEVWIFFANKHPKFAQLYESYKSQGELIDSMGKQLAAETLARINAEQALTTLGIELANMKLNSLKGDI